MNGNYEWNKQFSRHKMQQRFQEAELYRQARQKPHANKWQAKGYLRAVIGRFVVLGNKRLTAFFPQVEVRRQTEKI